MAISDSSYRASTWCKFHVLVATICAVGLSISQASAQQCTEPVAADRVALLIANTKYPDADTDIKHPINDARKLAESLRERGFKIARAGENLNKAETKQALDCFYRTIKPGGTALIYFAGFGLQAKDRSYLIPVDATIWTEEDARRDGLDAQSILEEVSARKAVHAIAVIDASRRNPFERRFRISPSGLGSIAGGKGSMVIYSAAPGKLADDDASDSVFMQELLKAIQQPGVTFDAAFNRTRDAVSEVSKGSRMPWVSIGSTESLPPATVQAPPAR